MDGVMAAHSALHEAQRATKAAEEPFLPSADDFALRVLQLAPGEDEAVYDARLALQAKDYGVSTTTASSPKSPFLATASKHTRRSTSTGSQESGLSNLTFDIGKPAERTPLSKLYDLTSERRGSATSSSFKDHDSVLGRVRFNGRRSLNLSPPPTPPQTSPLSFMTARAESSPRRNLMRGLSRLKLRRTESTSGLQNLTSCPHCPNDASRQRRSIHRLPCGHTYCTMALRQIIKTAVDRDQDCAPKCCDQAIPTRLVEVVMSQEEQDTLVKNMFAWDDSASCASSVSGRPERPTTDRQARLSGPNRRHRTLSEESSVLAMQEAYMNLGKALEVPDFKTLRDAQRLQRDRLSSWDRHHRESMQSALARQKQGIEKDFALQQESLREQHDAIISDVEDKHVAAEAWLRDSHHTERRNTATALRHMEAYCRGESANGQPHGRGVTDQDRRELERTRQMRDLMESRHESAINVLRGEQNQRMRLRLQRQEKETDRLERSKEAALTTADKEIHFQLQDWEEEVATKRARVESWWHLETEIWRKKLERDTGVLFDGDLPLISWQDDYEDNEHLTNRIDGYHDRDQSIEGALRLAPGKKDAGISTTFAVRSKVVG